MNAASTIDASKNIFVALGRLSQNWFVMTAWCIEVSRFMSLRNERRVVLPLLLLPGCMSVGTAGKDRPAIVFRRDCGQGVSSTSLSRADFSGKDILICRLLDHILH